MKKLSFFLLSFMVVGLGACKSEGPDAGQLAAIAAKGYYDLLLEGKYKDFVAGINQPDRLPDSYHDQLVMNIQMFVEQQNAEHKGMKRFDVLNAKADTTKRIADVYLSVHYGDSTTEQIVVPMVEVKGKWKMR